jgi:hypothetical protein
MVYSLLVCSDEGCGESLETWGELDDLEALGCECGCALQLLSVSEVEFVEPARRLALLPAEPTWEPSLALAA